MGLRMKIMQQAVEDRSGNDRNITHTLDRQD